MRHLGHVGTPALVCTCGAQTPAGLARFVELLGERICVPVFARVCVRVCVLCVCAVMVASWWPRRRGGVVVARRRGGRAQPARRTSVDRSGMIHTGSGNLSGQRSAFIRQNILTTRVETTYYIQTKFVLSIMIGTKYKANKNDTTFKSAGACMWQQITRTCLHWHYLPAGRSKRTWRGKRGRYADRESNPGLSRGRGVFYH